MKHLALAIVVDLRSAGNRLWRRRSLDFDFAYYCYRSPRSRRSSLQRRSAMPAITPSPGK